MEAFIRESCFELIEEEEPLAQILDLKTEMHLSFLCESSGLQEGVRLRALRRALRLSAYVIDQNGELDRSSWQRAMSAFKKTPHIYVPSGESDAFFYERQRALLERIPDLYPQIRRFQRPLCHQWAEQLIRDTLQLSSKIVLTNAHIRRSVLSACLTLLRQNVGSCFATAPAILIQEEQVERLLDDLLALLSTGRMKRVISGVEFSAPLSPSWGWGDLGKKVDSGKIAHSPGFLQALVRAGLIEPGARWERKIARAEELVQPFLRKGLDVKEVIGGVLSRHFGVKIEEREREALSAFRAVCDHPLLKAWEFTIASFSEARMEFSKWNLHVSLGLHQDVEGGIGGVIYRFTEEKLSESNERVERLQREYEQAFHQVKSVEVLLRGAGSESEARRFRAEYQVRFSQMQASLGLRDRAYASASQCASLFSFLIKQYSEKFPDYFQEIYDAEMHEARGDLYDDSPAGFRLVYKHGRSDPSSWSFIYNGEQFVAMLVDFFQMTESSIAADFEWEEARAAIQEVTTQVILHVRTREFLEGAIKRRKMPWAYVSGGSLSHLVGIYYRREAELTEEARWVESEQELLIHYLDVLKNLPEAQLKGGGKMLAYSPTHAFLLDPFGALFSEGWRDGGFTYTWVRDQIIEPRVAFYEKCLLTAEQQQVLIEGFAERLPPLLAHNWRREHTTVPGLVPLGEFRDRCALEPLLAEWDGFLYEMLPLTPREKGKEVLRALCKHPNRERALEGLPPLPRWIGRRALLQLAEILWVRAEGTPLLPYNVHQRVSALAAIAGIAPPPPLIVADTNWPGNFFAFLINPGTLSLELWRTDHTGNYGRPMHSWKSYLNGRERKPWGVFTQPLQYQ